MVAERAIPRRIGVRELRNNLNEVLREVREDNLTVDVTIHGQVIAELRPRRADPPPQGLAAVTPAQDEQHLRWREEMHRVATTPCPADPEEDRRREEELDRLGRRLSRGEPGTYSVVDQLRADRDAE